LQEIEEYINVIEVDEFKSMRIAIGGVERKLFFHISWGPNSYEEYFPFAVLTNAYEKSIPPTLVQEGDMFMGLKVKELRCSYYCRDESEVICFANDASVITVKNSIIIL